MRNAFVWIRPVGEVPGLATGSAAGIGAAIGAGRIIKAAAGTAAGTGAAAAVGIDITLGINARAGSAAGLGTMIGVPPFSLIMAHVNRGSDQSVATELAIDWNTEITDTDTIHDNSTNPSRLTIPAALNGRLVVVWATIDSKIGALGGAGWRFTITKNGSASFDGAGCLTFGSLFTTEGLGHVQSQPTIVSTGDFFELTTHTATGGSSIESDTSAFGLWVIA